MDIEQERENSVKLGYVEEVEHWRYSSAKNYLGGEWIFKVSDD